MAFHKNDLLKMLAFAFFLTLLPVIFSQSPDPFPTDATIGPSQWFESSGSSGSTSDGTGTIPSGTEATSWVISIIKPAVDSVLTFNEGTEVSFEAGFLALNTETQGKLKDVKWDWDFGDGTVHGTSQSLKHTFSKAGSFTVKVVATLEGKISQSELKITVKGKELPVLCNTIRECLSFIGKKLSENFFD